MSQLIDANKALDAVRKCCRDMMPQSKVIGLIDKAIGILQPAQEARALPSIPWGQIFGFWVGARPTTPPKLLPVGRLTFGEEQLLRDLQQAREEARQIDPCTVLVGCVAKAFRNLALPQGKSGQGDRIRYVDLDWISAFLQEKPQRIPLRRQRFVRQEK